MSENKINFELAEKLLEHPPELKYDPDKLA
jgi:hypothetical protein